MSSGGVVIWQTNDTALQKCENS